MLETYVRVNREALRKINKKYDKVVHGFRTAAREADTKAAAETAAAEAQDGKAAGDELTTAALPVDVVAGAADAPSASRLDAAYAAIADDSVKVLELAARYREENALATVTEGDEFNEEDERSTCERIRYAFSWRSQRCRQASMMAAAIMAVVIGGGVVVLAVQPDAMKALLWVGVLASFVLAWANGANDIANSVGTSAGAGAMTLKQAVGWGSLFEFIGAITMGQLVSKTISKGVIEPESYTDTPNIFALAMLCVLLGAGSTTLLATAYGFPISATHGIIGGLVAVGAVAKGFGSLGWGKLGATALSWVLSPTAGGVSSGLLYMLIHKVVLASGQPSSRAISMQPVFITLTVAISVLFIVIKGPSEVKVEPVGLAIVFALAVGAAVALCARLYSTLKGRCGGRSQFAALNAIDNEGGNTAGNSVEMAASAAADGRPGAFVVDESGASPDERESATLLPRGLGVPAGDAEAVDAKLGAGVASEAPNADSERKGDAGVAVADRDQIPSTSAPAKGQEPGAKVETAVTVKVSAPRTSDAGAAGDSAGEDDDEDAAEFKAWAAQREKTRAARQRANRRRSMTELLVGDMLVTRDDEIDRMSVNDGGASVKSVTKDSFHGTGSQSAIDAAEALKKERTAALAAAEKSFVPLLVMSALTVAFAHGGNDVGNAVGPLAALVDVVDSGFVSGTPDIPLWALALGATGFVCGIVVLGYKTIATVGSKITTLTPSKSFATQMGAGVAVLGSSVLGMPVSTSHCLVGAVVGVGVAQRCTGARGTVNSSVLKRIVIGWLVTIPLAMIVAMLFFVVLRGSYEVSDDCVDGEVACNVTAV